MDGTLLPTAWLSSPDVQHRDISLKSELPWHCDMPENTLVCAPPLPAMQRQSALGAVTVFILTALSIDISSMTYAQVGMKNICLSFQIKWLWPVFCYSGSAWCWHSQSCRFPVGVEPLLAPKKQPPCCQCSHPCGLQSPTEGPPGSLQGCQCSPGQSLGSWWQDEDTLEK